MTPKSSRVVREPTSEERVRYAALIENSRNFWLDVATENGWRFEPFGVQVWIDQRGGLQDSVAHRGLTEDLVLLPNVLLRFGPPRR